MIRPFNNKRLNCTGLIATTKQSLTRISSPRWSRFSLIRAIQPGMKNLTNGFALPLHRRRTALSVFACLVPTHIIARTHPRSHHQRRNTHTGCAVSRQFHPGQCLWQRTGLGVSQNELGKDSRTTKRDAGEREDRPRRVVRGPGESARPPRRLPAPSASIGRVPEAIVRIGPDPTTAFVGEAIAPTTAARTITWSPLQSSGASARAR